MSDSEDPVDLADEGGDDLFGDEQPEPRSDRERYLSENDLASERDANDEDSIDHDNDAMQTQQTKEEIVMDIALSRHRMPKMKNGTLQSLRVPNFLSFHAREYDPDTFEPTTWDMENTKSEKPKSVVRFRRDANTGELISNTLIHRWSDGSLTIAVGGNHYEIQTKKMAPPSNKPYQEREDGHYYAAAPHFLRDSLLTVGHVTEQYTVLLNRDMQDEAMIKLAESMAAAARGKRPAENEMIITATRDPELQKKEAELAERERMKAQRRRENAAARVDSRSTGYRSGGGLTVNDLEGGRRGAGGSRKRGAGDSSRAKRRRPEYDSDDDLPSGTRRQDEYDREDDFIAPSDDDMVSEVEEEEEEEDLLDDEEEEEAPRKKRQKTAEAEDDADADADADADLDDLEAPAPAEQSRARRRNIIDDDDE